MVVFRELLQNSDDSNSKHAEIYFETKKYEQDHLTGSRCEENIDGCSGTSPIPVSLGTPDQVCRMYCELLHSYIKFARPNPKCISGPSEIVEGHLTRPTGIA